MLIKKTNKNRKAVRFFLVLKIHYDYKSMEQLPTKENAVIRCGLRRSARVCLFKNLSCKILRGGLKEERQLGEVQIAQGREGGYQGVPRESTNCLGTSQGLRQPAKEKGLEQGYEHVGKFHALAKTGPKHSLGKKLEFFSGIQGNIIKGTQVVIPPRIDKNSSKL